MSDKSQESVQINESELPLLRDEIDRLDTEILSLISRRAQCAMRVAEVKTAANPESTVFYRPEREAQVLNRIMERNPGPLGNEDMARLFREIMSACLALEKPLEVAFLGPEGTFTQQAAEKHFGQWVHTRPMPAIDEVFREVEAGAAQYGVVPIENSTEGVVNHTLDTFITSNLKIVGEVELRIHQNLMIGPNTKLDKITRVYSHQQSLAQCRKWLDAHMPKAERIPVNSNAEAAKRVQGEWNSAAIAGELACKLYDLEVAEANIEDSPDNSTRFLIIGSQEVSSSGADKTSLVVSMRNEPGALYHLLKPFNDYGVDMTRLESRPSPSGQWTYVFFIDFAGHVDEPNVQEAMNKIKEYAVDIKVLGSYPKGVL
ncbi:MAG: prephenate dehydratase [Reinekea sp.]